MSTSVVVDTDAVEEAMVRNGDLEPVGFVSDSVAHGVEVPRPSF